MKKILRVFVKLVSGVIGRNKMESLLIYSAKSIKINLHAHGLLQIGAGTNVYLENGSELFFIKNVLAPQVENNKSPLLFDVGANIGNYTLALKKHIVDADVYAFEPVKGTFKMLQKNVGSNARPFNIGFSNLQGKGVLYNASNSTISEIATVHKDILLDVFKSSDEIEVIEFEMDTIDNFCLSNKIEAIDFLKIDVEGNELLVLQGASTMLANNGIKIIQFEINAHNIYARVFLRDFYLLLKDFEFFRLKANGMIKLGEHKPINEIFTAQNIVAIHKTLVGHIRPKYLFTI